MIHSVDEGKPGLVVRVQEAIMILMKRRPVKAPPIRSQYEVVLHLIEREVFAMLASQVHQVPVEQKRLFERGPLQVLAHPFFERFLKVHLNICRLLILVRHFLSFRLRSLNLGFLWDCHRLRYKLARFVHNNDGIFLAKLYPVLLLRCVGLRGRVKIVLVILEILFKRILLLNLSLIDFSHFFGDGRLGTEVQANHRFACVGSWWLLWESLLVISLLSH